MRHRSLLCTAALFLGSFGTSATAQVPGPVERLSPALVEQLRSRVSGAGFTPDQIRAQLRSRGYSESLLDGVFSPMDTARAPTRSAETIAAIRALGFADSLGLDTLSLLDSASAAPTVRRLAGVLDPRAARRYADSLPDAALIDSGFAIFGLDLFRSRTTQFEPTESGPVGAEYRLGAGDRLVLILTGDVETAHELEVTREGFVVVPQVGQMYVAGLPLHQADNVLLARLRRVYSGAGRGADASLRYSLSVASLRAHQVIVAGDVVAPGSYRVAASGTALTALYAAGGPSVNGSLRRIQVRRGTEIVADLDLYDYLLRGDASRDVPLRTGDVVFVPVHGARARLTGEVVRPGTYELAPGEALADVLRAAGGPTADADHRRVQIERVLPPERRGPTGADRIVVDAPAVGDGTPVHAGDVVRVFSVASRVRGRVRVAGHVWSPGTVALNEGLRLSDALRAAGGVRPGAYLGQVAIVRTLADSSETQLRAVLRDTAGTVLNDLTLQEDDSVHVFAIAEFRTERYVTIAGAVRTPGQFAYRDGMTLRDIVAMAGGLQEGAYLREAEVASLTTGAGTTGAGDQVTAHTVRVPLDSSYLFTVGGTPTAPDVALRAYDHVLILQQPEWELTRTVVITGEVAFPGRYALRSKTDRLRDLVTRAGGVTRDGYAAGVHFSRVEGNVGRLGLDLPGALADAAHRDNLLLTEGDSVHVPRYQPVVLVQGSVSSPIGVPYHPGKALDYYIRAAGGPSRNADLARAYVVQPNGFVEAVHRRRLRPDAQPTPGPGSRVQVPERDATEQRDLRAIGTTVAQVLASIVALVAVLSR